jgi:hypothetical protein
MGEQLNPRNMRGSLGMATLGLAINFVLWSIPVVVGATALPHALFPDSTPTLAQALATLSPSAPTASPALSLSDALLQLVGAESEAMHVAGAALQQPLPADIGPQADHAGVRVQDALETYLRAAQNVVEHSRLH